MTQQQMSNANVLPLWMSFYSDIFRNLTGTNDSSSDSSLNDCSKPAAYKHDNLAEYGQFGTINGQIGRQMNFGTFIATLRV